MKKRLILTSLLTLALIVALVTAVAGCAGEPGLKGSQGKQGIQGEQGEQGEQGIQGVQGSQGEQGEPGPKGSTGAKGATGATGSKGATGEQGPQGDVGSPGPRGSSGSTGAKGATGAQGPAGPPGSDAECEVFPTIDGIMGLNEWDGATVVYVASEMGTVSVLAYANYLYVLFDVADTTDARLGENIKGNDQIGLNINPTLGEPWGKPYDIIFQTGADPAAFTTIPPGGVSSGMSDGWYTEWVIAVKQLPYLPGNVETVTIYSGGRRISEWRVPLATIGVSPGDSIAIGGAIDVGDGSSYKFPATLNWADPETFVGITVR